MLSREDVTDLWQVRRLPDRRADGELSFPPLRDLGGWSSVNPGVDTTYVRSLPLPGAGRTAVLRLHGLSAPVHVAIGGGPEQRVMPPSPLVVLDGGQAADVEVVLRAPHVPGGLLESAELLVTAAPRVQEVRRIREAELAAQLARRAREADPAAWRPPKW